jgi:hypothetical protein
VNHYAIHFCCGWIIVFDPHSWITTAAFCLHRISLYQLVRTIDRVGVALWPDAKRCSMRWRGAYLDSVIDDLIMIVSNSPTAPAIDRSRLGIS